MPSHKEKAWLEAYLGEARFNAAKAARIAGYKYPKRLGYRKKKKFATEIEERLNEKTLKANEILSLLTDHATADMANYIRVDPKDGRVFTLDLNKAQELDVMHLIKKLKYSEYGPEIQLVDSQSALDKLAKAQGVYKEAGTEDQPYVIKIVKGVSTDDV